jgi:thymidylate kinase
MLNTQLILIEGLPGAGKSTSTSHLGTILQQRGITCSWFREEDESHPIACLDFEIKGMTPKMVHLWTNFVQQTAPKSIVTIIESRLWQNTALFMHMSENDIDDIIKFNKQINQVLTPLSPVLIYLDQDNIETALQRMYNTRGEEWMKETLKDTLQYQWFKSRGIKDFAGWVNFFEDWHDVAERLYTDWTHKKIKIMNPHDDWTSAYEKMYTFLEVAHNP